jgi:hypothetical protein
MAKQLKENDITLTDVMNDITDCCETIDILIGADIMVLYLCFF